MNDSFCISSPALFPVWGILAFAVSILGTAFPAFAYRGRGGQKYNPLNHFISELGEEGVSRRAGIFNYGLIFCGALLAVFFVQLGRSFATPAGFVTLAAGAVMCASLMLVGVYPMNKMKIHLVVATLAFIGGAATFTALGTSIVTDTAGRLPFGFGIAAYIVALDFGLFLVVPTVIQRKISLDPVTYRPRRWYLPMLEWSTVTLTMAFVVVISLYIFLQPQWGTALYCVPGN